MSSRISLGQEELKAVCDYTVNKIFAAANIAREQSIFELADDATLAELRTIGFGEKPRAPKDVVDELLELVYPNIARMNHPRAFAFIPSPVSSLSWLGDMLTSAFNPHAGSWLQSSGPSSIEKALIRYMNDAIGFSEKAGGLFVSGGSMANLTALTVARDRMLSAETRAQAVAYVSEQTHSSVAKGLKIIGFFDEQIRKIPTTDSFQMDVQSLQNAIIDDKNNGRSPFAIVASAGTTNTGSVDPLHSIAEIANTHHLWMHVDGAYGASVVLSNHHKHLLDGIQQADSVSWDAHKWLFQTYGCGCILMKDASHLLDTYHTRPEYLRDASSSEDTPNYWDYGPELTRPARGLKLWLTLQVLGAQRMGEAIDHGFTLAQWAADEIAKYADWNIISGPHMAIVNFRYEPEGCVPEQCDELNRTISKKMIENGYAGVLTTQLHGQTVLRICAIHPDATEQDMRKTIQMLNDIAITVVTDGALLAANQ